MKKRFDVKTKRMEAEKLANGKLAKIKELEAKKEEAIQSNKEILDKLTVMPESLSIDEYSKLKYSADLTNATVGFYESKIEAIKMRGLVGQEESDQLLSDVRAEQEIIVEEAQATILPMVEKLLATIESYTDKLDECTDLLVFWGNNVGNYSNIRMNAWFELEAEDNGLKMLMQTLKHCKAYKLLTENE